MSEIRLLKNTVISILVSLSPPFTFPLGSSSIEEASCHALKTLEQPYGEAHVVRN